MFATKRYLGPFWQGVFLTAAFFLLGFDSARAVTEQPVDYSPAELEELVGPVALYPDDLIGIILPASTYPLQIVEAARYLEAHETNPALQPDEDWDDAVVALLNYPEVIELLNEDLDWTWNLGEAVVNQQADVLDAVQNFRSRAVMAGNFKSDDRQNVTYIDEVIEVTPVDPEIIYVPYYEPSSVIVYQRWPAYHYYPRPYPVYYYPYPAHYSFASGFFWGVTTAYTIGWLTDRVHFHYYGYASHPYYGHHYANHYYSRHARRVRHYNYAGPRNHYGYNKRHYGNTWKPKNRHGDRPRHRSPDRHRANASNFSGSPRPYGSAGSRRPRSGDQRNTSTRFASNQDSRQDTRTRQTRGGDGRGRTGDSGTNSRDAVTNQSGNSNGSRENRTVASRSGSKQVIDTRNERRTGARSASSKPRRVSKRANNSSQRTARETRNENSVQAKRGVKSRSGTNQVIDTRNERRTSARPASSKPRRVSKGANSSSQRTARETRNENSVRVNRTATQVSSSATTPRRANARTQPRQKHRQAKQAPRSSKRSASATRVASIPKSKSGNRATTRVASAARKSAGRTQTRGRGSSTRRGFHR